MRPCLLLSLVITFGLQERICAVDEGLFATIATSKGTIRAQLEYEKAPTTVANFVGLIEGSQTALDIPSGTLKRRGGFYDGMIFHRVIGDLMIETGSPDRSGTDGPGYVFQDEFDPSLTHEPFVLSMANNGPNSNGSQFFIPVKETPWLNNVHTVFGKVVEGMDVVTAISEVKTNQADNPLVDVVIERITIQRVGAAAEAFAVSSIKLPVVRHLNASWRQFDGKYRLDTIFQRNSEVLLYTSPDLRSWSSERIAFLGDEELPEVPVDVSAQVKSQRMGYFRIAEIAYPTVVFPPAFLPGKTFDGVITRFGNSATTSALSYQFNTPTTGKAKLGASPAVNLRTYLYRIESPTRATLIVPSDLLSPLDLPQFSLNFTSATTGTFTAVLPLAFPAPITIAGTFLLNETP